MSPVEEPDDPTTKTVLRATRYTCQRRETLRDYDLPGGIHHLPLFHMWTVRCGGVFFYAPCTPNRMGCYFAALGS